MVCFSLSLVFPPHCVACTSCTIVAVLPLLPRGGREGVCADVYSFCAGGFDEVLCGGGEGAEEGLPGCGLGEGELGEWGRGRDGLGEVWRGQV